jgi:L-alanine-DL-glutamate epimerase-like enolase superfamily enzyme
MVGAEGEQLDYRTRASLLPPKTLDMIESRLAAVRKSVGREVDIIIENHSFPDANAAVQIMQMAEPYKILFFEEPNTPSPQTSRYIKENTNIPIANGERVFSRWQYIPYFADGTIQVDSRISATAAA